MSQEVFPSPAALAAIEGMSELTMDEKQALRRQLMTNSTGIGAALELQPEMRAARLKELAHGASDADTPMLAVPTSPAEDALMAALKSLDQNQDRALVRSALRSLSTVVKNLQTDSTSLKHRRLAVNNMVIKKFIVGVPGAKDVLQAIGFREEKGTHLEYQEPADAAHVLSLASSSIDDKLNKLEDSKSAPPVPAASAASSAAAQPAAARTFCTAGCGFFGDPNLGGMCSVCAKRGAAPVAAAASSKCSKLCGSFGSAKFNGMCSVCFQKAKSAGVGWHKRIHMARLKLRAMRLFRLGIKPVQKNRKRCLVCSKKLGIAGFECRCGYVYCSEHRYAGQHNCTFDYQEAHRKRLEEENQRIFGKKLKRLDSESDLAES